jgi:hypothetical protein
MPQRVPKTGNQNQTHGKREAMKQGSDLKQGPLKKE